MGELNVQMVDEKLKEELKLFPATKPQNIFISDDPLVTLDEWMSEQETRNARYDKAVNKINAFDRESMLYKCSESRPNPNPSRNMLWAHIIKKVGE